MEGSLHMTWVAIHCGLDSGKVLFQSNKCLEFHNPAPFSLQNHIYIAWVTVWLRRGARSLKWQNFSRTNVMQCIFLWYYCLVKPAGYFGVSD